MLQGMAAFMGSHTDGRNRAVTVDVRRQAQCAAARVIVIGEHTLRLFYGYVEKAKGAQNAGGCLRASQPAQRAHLRVLVKRAFHHGLRYEAQNQRG